MKKVTLKLSGLHCTACSLLIDTVLEELEGVHRAKTSYAGQIVEVEFDEGKVIVEKMISVIKNEGYSCDMN